jgi:hypothetical protein
MDKKKTLDDIFDEEDELGLLDIKPKVAAGRNEDERLTASFEELNAFYEKHKREPQPNGGMQERGLYSRLKGLRENPTKAAMLQSHDRFGLLKSVQKEINSLDDIFDDDAPGLLDDEGEGLFELKHVRPLERERAEADFIARRKPCKDFTKYETLLQSVQKDLANGKRKLLDFKQSNLREGAFYVHNGLLFLLEKVTITQKEQYLPDGKRLREDGRTRCIFENGTESNMLKRSVEKILYTNGQVVSENADTVVESFRETFSDITDEDQKAGFIYILKSKSTNPEISGVANLYKIGYSKIPVEERIKNARLEPTYLMADVRIVMAYQCYNMNPQKLEQLLHTFFGSSCLDVDVFDRDGRRHTPREWFIAPLSIIEQAIQLILSGEVVKYRYDAVDEIIVARG